jgi:hypothetical protein
VAGGGAAGAGGSGIARPPTATEEDDRDEAAGVCPADHVASTSESVGPAGPHPSRRARRRPHAGRWGFSLGFHHLPPSQRRSGSLPDTIFPGSETAEARALPPQPPAGRLQVPRLLWSAAAEASRGPDLRPGLKSPGRSEPLPPFGLAVQNAVDYT